MTKLHELIAVESDLKAEALRLCTEVGELFTKGINRLTGQVRKYSPLAEDGEKLADEVAELATTVKAELAQLRNGFGRWLDVTVQKEVNNGRTSANVEVDGIVVLANLPAPALLNLESKLATLRAVYTNIPTNDQTERWEFDPQQGIYISVPKETYRTRKVPKALVMHEATKEHPAQVQAYTEDVREGVWTTVKKSGMISPAEKRELLERLDALIRAVKTARQRANDTEIDPFKVSDHIFKFIHRE